MKKLVWIGILLVLLILAGITGYVFLNNHQATSTYNAMNSISPENQISAIPNASNTNSYTPVY